jgi:hypothetical protein
MTDPSLRDIPAPVRYIYRGTLVVGAVLPFVPSMLGRLPSGLLTAAALLLIAAGCLMVSYARGNDGSTVGFGAAAIAAAPGILILVITLYPATVLLVLGPLTWLTTIWAGVPDGLGMTPPWSTYPIEVVYNPYQPLSVAVAAVAAGVAAFAIHRRRRAALLAVGLVLPLSLPLTLIAIDAPWPAVSLATLTIGIGLTAIATLDTVTMWSRVAAGSQGLSYVAAGAAGCLATPTTTVLALAAVTATAVWAGWRGRSVVRVFAWVFAILLGAFAGAAGVLAAGYGRASAAFGVLAVCVAALAMGAAIRASRRDEAHALAGSAHMIMVVAVLLTAGSPAAAILLCAIWTAAVTARIWLPGVSTMDRRFLAIPAAAWATVTWWLVLGPPAGAYTEQYTLPVAAVALLAGWANRRRWHLTKRWAAYGPALLLAVLPTAAIAAETNDQWRWLAVTMVAGAGAVLLLRRRRAPTAANGV